MAYVLKEKKIHHVKMKPNKSSFYNIIRRWQNISASGKINSTCIIRIIQEAVRATETKFEHGL